MSTEKPADAPAEKSADAPAEKPAPVEGAERPAPVEGSERPAPPAEEVATTAEVSGDAVVLAVGDFVVSEDSGYTYTGGVLTITAAGEYDISMASGTTTDDYIVIDSNIADNVTLNLNSVTISTENTAIKHSGTGELTINLSGENYITTTSNGDGIDVTNKTLNVTGDGDLTIDAKDTGILTADGSTTNFDHTGKITVKAVNNGIGNTNAVGTININSGTIDATATGTGSNTYAITASSLNVAGGEVTATSIVDSNGIGFYINTLDMTAGSLTADGYNIGIYATGGSIYISGGNVYAESTDGAAMSASKEFIVSDGAYVEAKGVRSAISCYCNQIGEDDDNNPIYGAITITGEDTEVTATATDDYSEAIYSSKSLYITDGATVTATAEGEDGIAIEATSISITGGAYVEATATTEEITGDKAISADESILISGESTKVVATADDDAIYSEYSTEDGTVDAITIDGATVIANSNDGDAIRASESGALVKISNGAYVTAESVDGEGIQVEGLVIDQSTVLAESEDGDAIKVDDSDMTITNSTVTATATEDSDDCYAINVDSNLSITNSIVIATAGVTVSEQGDAYAIYAYEDVSISGSDVEATATVEDETTDDSYAIYAEEGDITIADSEVIAIADFVGIYAKNSSISITNSTVTAEADYAIYAEEDITIGDDTDSATVYAYGTYEGIGCSGILTIKNDKTFIQASGTESVYAKDIDNQTTNAFLALEGEAYTGATKEVLDSDVYVLYLDDGTDAVATNVQLGTEPTESSSSSSKKTYYYIKVSVTGNGTVDPDGEEDGMIRVEKYDDIEFEIEPDSGYEVSQILVDGKEVDIDDEYEFEYVISSHTLEVVFVASDDVDDDDDEDRDDNDKDDADVELTLNTEDHFAYVSGYPDESFAPDANITRAETVVIFSRLLTEAMDADETYTSTFTDVSAGDWYANQVGYMEQFGIVSGYEDGSFGGTQSITRAEFAAIASRFADLESTDENVFADVADEYWAADYINSAAAKGWISGYADGTFKPQQSITRAEAITIVNNVLERGCDLQFVLDNYAEILFFYDVPATHWAYAQIIEATNGHEYEMVDGKEVWIELY